MTLPKAIRMRGKRRVLLLTTAILGVMAAAAVAATVGPADGTLVGSPQGDSITTKGGNDVVYGEGGSDTITIQGLQGDNMVDGDGSCKDGNGKALPPGVYPNPLRSSDACEHGNQDSQGQMDTVTESSRSTGDDVVIGGAAGNTVTLGNGDDTFYAPNPQWPNTNGTTNNNKVTMGGGNDTVHGGPNNDMITLGNGNDTVYLGSGTNMVTVGSGNGKIYAYSSGDTRNVDTIKCANRNTIAYVNTQDKVTNCTRVNHAPASDPPATHRAKKASRRHHRARTHKKA
jgi:Ca2+-binding RTX toxin-like protein